MKTNPTIYFAASLFNGRETFFNAYLADRLGCDADCELILPQRDGLEFTSLIQSLSGKLPPQEVMPAVKNIIIYILDIGHLIPRADMIIANLDEPQDEGVLIEMPYARKMGKKVIGFRTDTRSPYGTLDETFGGMHTFPVNECDIMVRHFMPAKTKSDADRELEGLARKLRQAITELKPLVREGLPEYALSDPDISRRLSNAKILFEGLENYNSDESISEIAERYIKNKSELEKMIPKVIV